MIPRRTAYAFLFSWALVLVLGGCTGNRVLAQPLPNKTTVGVELDILPYLTGGYFGAFWIAKGRLRGRVLTAKVHMPEFIVPDGFTNNDIESYALVADYFLRPHRDGWWLSSGLVLWRGRIQSEARIETVAYESYLLNGSLGYVQYLTAHLYLSPWAGMSVRMGGDSPIVVDGKDYEAPVINPEVSLKVGWGF